jgi:hypothetical protein
MNFFDISSVFFFLQEKHQNFSIHFFELFIIIPIFENNLVKNLNKKCFSAGFEQEQNIGFC